MSGLANLRAAAKGTKLSSKPVIVWSASPGHKADGIIATLNTLEDALRSHPGQAVLVEIVSPFGRATREGINLTEILTDQPEAGAHELAGWASRVGLDMQQALKEGASGIFYRLDGAYPAANTPMQYGGLFLETDRELLKQIPAEALTLLYVEGESDPYLDFVSDLPADLFGWDAPRTGIEAAEVLNMREGALAAEDKGASVLFVKSFDDALNLMGEAS